jgi:outer membrane protein TolC
LEKTIFVFIAATIFLGCTLNAQGFKPATTAGSGSNTPSPTTVVVGDTSKPALTPATTPTKPPVIVSKPVVNPATTPATTPTATTPTATTPVATPPKPTQAPVQAGPIASPGSAPKPTATPSLSPTVPNAKPFEEYLVGLALRNNPNLAEFAAKMKDAEARIGLANRRWLNGVTLNGGGQTSNQIVFVNGQAIFPGYNVGLGLSLGPLFEHKNSIKQQKANQDLVIAQQKVFEAELRRMTLTAYRIVLMNIEIYSARLQAVETATANRALIQELFSSNQAEFDELNGAETTYFGALEKLSMAEAEIAISKYELEELVGEKWDNLDRVRQTYKK